MERLLNDGWRFAKLPNGSTYADACSTDSTPVDLPHDFLIFQADNLYENADGWYTRTLNCPAEWTDKAVWVRFDGVYMDCDVLLNGHVVCTHHYGYTCFDAVLTDFIQPGENQLQVHVRHTSPNSRWYSGAGIFRDVTLCVMEKSHIVQDGIYVSTERQANEWLLRINTELSCESSLEGKIVHRLLLKGDLMCQAEVDPCGKHVECCMQIRSPECWSVDHPVCYTLETTYGPQKIRTTIGFREMTFTTDRGLLLNGQPVKLHGVCLHHDLGALGSAFHVKAARRQLAAMKKMGVNSLRTSHNPPARQVMDLCDEMGILVVNEAFDMWKRQKNPYDYARFFETDAQADVAAWVRRDRNHPSMLMWSIGNEIFDTHVDESAVETTQMLCDLVRQHDPRGNAITTIGSNFMPWAGAQKCAEYVQAVGYNYGERLYEAHHREHPEWAIYGSETASTVATRGVYRFPMSASILSDDDLQCSSLGNSTTSWGTKDMRRCLVEDLNTPFSLGQYLWTGIDYIGEPTPYHTRSSYFGMMDTCVFPKDYWYLCKSLWNPEPMAHIGVHWNWNPGQTIDVAVMTNGASAELILNGRSLGVQDVDPTNWERCRPTWQVPFEAGEIRAIARDKNGIVIAEDVRRTAGDSCRIVLQAEDDQLYANGEDMTFVTISAVDHEGNPVENAADWMHVEVRGSGRLMGLDNGDSTDKEGYKVTTRRLFAGKLLAMVGAGDQPGTLQIEVTSPGKEMATLTLPVLPADKREGVSCGMTLCQDTQMPQEQHVTSISLTPLGDKRLTPEHPSVSFRYSCHPDGAMAQDVTFRITNAKGIESPCAAFRVEGDVVTVTGTGDDLVYLRAMCCNGYDHPRVISQQDIRIEGMGKPNLDPYGFITGGLHTLSYGDVGNGNEQGVSFARDGESMAGYERIDFGPVGSDEITLPVFALDSLHYDITLWDGDPRQNGRVVAVLPYQKPSRWNVYQPETYQLPERLTGMHTLCFTMTKKIHLKGFSFTRQSRAWLEQSALTADVVYGDSFTRTEAGVLDIGNNVTFEFTGMDFGNAAKAGLSIDGRTPLEENPITIRVQNADGESVTSLAQFRGTERSVQSFAIDVLPGECTVTFVFLPGCQFDFYSFKFTDRKD